jgi:hypothetical protein
MGYEMDRLGPMLHLTCTKGQVKKMNRLLGQLKVFGEAAAKQAKVRKGLVAILAAFLVLQVYFVRELLAAELLFGLLFAVVLVIGGIVYALGTLSERAIDVGEAGARVIANSTRRGYVLAEEIGKKSARYINSVAAR